MMRDSEQKNRSVLPSLKKSISFSVKLRDDVVAEQLGDGRLALLRNGQRYWQGRPNPLVAGLMEQWMTEDIIDRLAEREGDSPGILFVAAKLFSLGLLQGKCTLSGRPLFSLVPAPDWIDWQKTIPPSFRTLSRYICLRRDGEGFLLEMPLSKKKCIIHDERCLKWLMDIIRKGVLLPDEQKPGRSALCHALWQMNALEGNNEESDRSAWEFHDQLFFHHSSIGFHDSPLGATLPLKGKRAQAPLFKPVIGDSVSLPQPDSQLTKKLQAPFAQVLAGRRSSRLPGSRLITIEELAALLYVSARVQDILDDPVRPCPGSLRPSPSGGALHSLEIYILVHRCVGLPSGAWRYDPVEHRLEAVPANDDILNAYLRENPHAFIEGAGLPHIRLVVTSRFLRDSWKYEKIAFRLVLQDLGCLYQTLSLAAEAIGLSSCILGTVDARRLAAILNLDPLVEPAVGEMTLSSG